MEGSTWQTEAHARRTRSLLQSDPLQSSGKKTYSTKSGKRSTTPPSRRWSAKVKTDSTKPATGSVQEIREADRRGAGQEVRLAGRNRTGDANAKLLRESRRKKSLGGAQAYTREGQGYSAREGREGIFQGQIEVVGLITHKEPGHVDDEIEQPIPHEADLQEGKLDAPALRG